MYDRVVNDPRRGGPNKDPGTLVLYYDEDTRRYHVRGMCPTADAARMYTRAVRRDPVFASTVGGVTAAAVTRKAGGASALKRALRRLRVADVSRHCERLGLPTTLANSTKRRTKRDMINHLEETWTRSVKSIDDEDEEEEEEDGKITTDDEITTHPPQPDHPDDRDRA
jgi:hypothetical protein